MHKLRRKLQALWRRRQLDRDLGDELRFHLDMKAEETGDRMQAQRGLFATPSARSPGRRGSLRLQW